MDSKQTHILKFLMLIFASVFSISIIGGCSSSKNEEPPQDFGEGKPGELVRSTKLVDLNPNEDRIVYEIQYPRHGLTSVAVLGFRSRALREETYSKKWKIIYEYSKEWPEYHQIPSSYTIYGYSQGTGKYDRLINRYTLIEVKPNQLFYRDTAGKIRVRDTSYFIILSQP